MTSDNSGKSKRKPRKQVASVEQRQVVIEAMRKLASQNQLRGLKIRDLIDEGRR